MDRPEARLALIELLDRDGRVLRAVDVHRWPLTLGRALDDTVVLDDPHVGAGHARLALDEAGGLTLHAGPSRNGVLLDGQRLAPGAQQALPAAGALLQLGAARLRLRLPGEALAPEQALVPGPTVRPALLALLALLTLASMTAGHWVTLDPGADFTDWLPLLLSVPAALVVWCGGWALASKLFQHRFDFWGHVRLLLPWALAIELTGLLPQIGASLGWPWLWQLATPLRFVLLALLLRAHLEHVLPQHTRIVGAAVAALALLSAALTLTTLHRRTDGFARAPYMSTLPMPALRLGATVSPEALVDAMAPLRDQLATRVRQARADEAEAEAEAELGD